MRGPDLLPVDPSTGPRLPGVQGLRALAAVSILTSHVWLHSLGAPERFDLALVGRLLAPQLALGVTLLLLLSGFLLYRPFAAALLHGTRTPSLRRYLVNRALRIFPAYWAILLVTVFVFQTSLVRSETVNLEPQRMTDPLHLLLDLFLLQGFVPQALLTGIGPAWALTAVVTFYAVLPILVLAAGLLVSSAAKASRRALAALAPAVLLVLVGIAGKVTASFVVPPGGYGGWGADWHSVIERSFFAHADVFGLGMAVAVLHVLREDGRLRLPARWRPVTLLLMLAVALPTTKFLTTEADVRVDAASNSAYDLAMAAVGAAFLAWVLLPDPAAARPWLVVRLLEWRAVVAVGVVSYSLFLWHEPLIFLLRRHGLTFAGPSGFVVNLVVVAVLAFLLSVLTYHFFERPALVRKSRSSVAPQEPLAGASATAEWAGVRSTKLPEPSP